MASELRGRPVQAPGGGFDFICRILRRDQGDARFYHASLQNTVDHSEADPSSWRRILLRSNMDFVPVETLFNFQGAVMSVSLIVRIIVSLLPLNSHDCGSLPFLNHCIVIHSF